MLDRLLFRISNQGQALSIALLAFLFGGALLMGYL
jgi:hypothetical protein